MEYVKDTKSLKKCKADDILIARYGASVGKILTGLSGAYNVAIVKTIPDKNKIYPRYLFHYFNSAYFQNFIRGVGSRAAQAGFNKGDLESAVIPVRSLDKQRKIATVLDKVSELIVKRRQQLDKLDLLVKSKFVEMFGDELNPNSWNQVAVEEVAEVCVGVVIKPTQYYTNETGIPAFRSLNIGPMYVKDSGWVYFTEEGHQKNNKSIIRENDILIVRSGAPGTACVATKQFEGYNAVDIIIAHPNIKK